MSKAPWYELIIYYPLSPQLQSGDNCPYHVVMVWVVEQWLAYSEDSVILAIPESCLEL
jgi:hypothetical protein